MSGPEIHDARAVSRGAGKREAPAALDVERTVLGTLLIEPKAFADVAGLLKSDEAFFGAQHRAIFRAIRSLADEGRPVDTITTGEALKAAGELDAAGGPAYLADLTMHGRVGVSLEFYARILLERWFARRLITLGAAIIQSGYDPSSDVFDLLESAEKELFDIGSQTSTTDLTPIADGLHERVVEIATTEAPDGITGIDTGLDEVNELTGGWQRSDLIIVAARPSMGKTGLATKVATAAAEQGYAVALFSLEMSKRQLADRMLATEARVDSTRIRRLRTDDGDNARLAHAAARLSKLRILIDDSPAMTAGEILSKARRASYRLRDTDHPLGLVIVDYLQLIVGHHKAGNREQEIAYASRQLKLLAKELDVPVIALSQLSRQCETRGDKRPILADLRESGAIEQDADVVLAVYRGEYYGEREDQDGHSTAGVAELIIRKQRNGPLGTAHVAWVSRYATFENLSPADRLLRVGGGPDPF